MNMKFGSNLFGFGWCLVFGHHKSPSIPPANCGIYELQRTLVVDRSAVCIILAVRVCGAKCWACCRGHINGTFLHFSLIY